MAVLCCAAPLAAQAPSLSAQLAVERAAATINAADVRRRIGVIAADSMRGRYTPSPELEETAEWIASEFRSIGLRPGGDSGSFLQHYPIRAFALEPAESKARLGSSDLRFGRDVAPAYPAILPTARLEGPLLVVSGTGLDTGPPEGITVTGTHVLVVPPSGADVRATAVAAVVRSVLAAGPLAVWIASDRGNADWASAANEELLRQHTVIGDPDPLAALVVRDRVVRPVLAALGMDLAVLRARGGETVRWDDAQSVSVELEAAVQILIDASAPNVVGILPGSDPELRDEYVVFSAHMDHVGVGEPDASGDSIYNGADDDASGTVTVVELAEAFASLETRPRRSLVFLTVSGEERGLWGSGWFVDHPPVPLEGMVADLNIDMVGRNWSDTIVAIGREHSDLGETLAYVNAQHPELGMTAIDDLWPTERFYMRSDHYRFARRGIPILFFFNGIHPDYHEPSDEVGKIDADKTARIGRLIFYLGLEVANRTARPVWDPASRRAIVGGG
jgi:hypothetical protein